MEKQALLFLFAFLSLALPVLLLVLRNSEYRERLFVYFPVGVAIQVLSVAIISSLLFKILDFGWAKYAITIITSSMLVHIALRRLHTRRIFVCRNIFNGRTLIAVSVLAFIAVIDNFIVLGKQGLLDTALPYFRPGLQSDPVRNVIIVNALLREDGSPFLPGTAFSYQILWHQFASLFVAPFATAQNFRLVNGVTILMGYLLFFFLFWTIAILRPGLALRYKFALFALIAVIAATHADFYNYFLKGCVEADGSCGGTEYNNFSVKLVSLSSPQHAFFLIALMFFYGTNRLLRSDRDHFAHRIVSFATMFLISPVLCLFFLPCYFSYRCLILSKRRMWSKLAPTVLEVIASLTAGVLLYWSVTRDSPLDLFTRPNPGSLGFFPFDKDFLGAIAHLLRSLFWTPRTVVWGFGVLELAAMLLVFVRLYKRIRERGWISPDAYHYAFLALGVLYLFNYIVVQGEIRRHIVILLSPIIVLMVLKLLPAWRKLKHSFLYLTASVAALVLSGYLHGKYIYAYTIKPSVVTSDIDWSDYACINEKIYRLHVNAPTLAAAAGGLVFPPVMEITSSFARPGDAYVHSKVPGDKLVILRRIESGALPVDFAGELGFRNIVWGPLETIEWGNNVRARIIGNAPALETCGKVSLYKARTFSE